MQRSARAYMHRYSKGAHFVYVCVASLLSVLLTVKRVGYLVPIRAEVAMEFTHAHTRTIINLYSIRGKCHMIAESAQPRNPSPDPFPRSAVGGVWGRD